MGRFTRQAVNVLASHVAVGDPLAYARLAQMKAGLIARGSGAVAAGDQALRLLDAQISGQAAMIGFERAFFLGGILFFASIPLVLLMDDGRGRTQPAKDGA